MQWKWRSGLPAVLVLLALIVVTAAMGGEPAKKRIGTNGRGRPPAVASNTVGVPAGFAVRLFTRASPGSKPDDITRLDGQIFVTYQNDANATGHRPGRRAPSSSSHPGGRYSISGT